MPVPNVEIATHQQETLKEAQAAEKELGFGLCPATTYPGGQHATGLDPGCCGP